MQNDIDRILNGPTYTTDEQEAKGPVRLIDIHVYHDVPEDELPPVEDQIVESTPPAPEPEANEAETPIAPRIHTRLMPWFLAGLCLFAVVTLLAVFYLLP